MTGMFTLSQEEAVDDDLSLKQNLPPGTQANSAICSPESEETVGKEAVDDYTVYGYTGMSAVDGPQQ